MSKKNSTDILIVGGGTGGVAAALAATSMGKRVIITEETDWLGGQLTSQLVPPDENLWIEGQGCTMRYRKFRDSVRQYYRDHYPLLPEVRSQARLNPGKGQVSPVCHEPRVSVAVLDQMLAYARCRGLLDVRFRHKPIAAECDGDRIRSVTFHDLEKGDEVTFSAPYVLDATELGDLLPLAGVEYVTGAESRSETGELHAVDGPAQPENVQALTWCAALAYDPTPGADHTIEKPASYDFWKNFTPQLTPPWPGRLLDVTDLWPANLSERTPGLFADPNTKLAVGQQFSAWWPYRRIVHSDFYPREIAPHEVTIVNWPHNDYMCGNIIDKPEQEVARHLEASRQQTLSLVYWLQTERPRPDGGQGFPGLYLRPDIAGTRDGLAKAAYIRESRRIRAVFTITEGHIGAIQRGGWDTHRLVPKPPDAGPQAEPEKFVDTVGVGNYRIDLHPSTGGDNYIDIPCLPFQIPLGALLPVRVRNLLPACKNIGTTHITNGCYRLHPVEWNIGEAAGLLAAYCLKNHTEPHAVREDSERLKEFQNLLVNEGVQLDWLPFGPR
jgi:hypothetical protein